MQSLFQDLPPVEVAGRKLVGRVVLGLLVLISALVGATAGLLLVYTTDLPQVEALEAYRPSSITELYDDHGRVIGSFALQRRVVAGYDDFALVCRGEADGEGPIMDVKGDTAGRVGVRDGVAAGVFVRLARLPEGGVK